MGVFGAAEELEDGVGTEDDGEPAPEAGEEFQPSGVIVVQASDEDCRARALAAPEGEFDEASFAAALEAYRAANAEDNERSPASYFEAACRVETLESASMEDISLYLEKGQKPFNYHPTPKRGNKRQRRMPLLRKSVRRRSKLRRLRRRPRRPQSARRLRPRRRSA